MKLLLVLVALLVLAGCSFGAQVAGDVASDAASAAALAKATGDTGVIQCYTDIGAIGTAVANATGNSTGATMTLGPVTMNAGANAPKLLTKVEIARSLQGLIADPNCASLELSLANFALKSAVPGLGGILP